MIRFLSVILSTFFLVFNTACAENATAPVGPRGGNEQGSLGGEEESEAFTANALVFKGRDPFGTSCNLHLAIVEEEGHDGEEHEHAMVAKLDYTIHGQAPADMEVEFKNYSFESNSFTEIDNKVAGSIPVLAAALLKDENAEVDLNDVESYEESGALEQFLRLDFEFDSADAFTEDLETVLEDSSQLAALEGQLDQLESLVMKIYHVGHYDALACSGFKPASVELTEFNLHAEHEHEEEHEHEHEHEHDDHGDDH